MPEREKLKTAVDEILGKRVSITLSGREKLICDSYQKLEKFFGDRIVIRTHDGLVAVYGQNLTISAMGAEGLVVTGAIKTIEYE